MTRPPAPLLASHGRRLQAGLAITRQPQVDAGTVTEMTR
jgi:hypothetical protein